MFNASLIGCPENIFILYKDRLYTMQNSTMEMRSIMPLNIWDYISL